MRLLYNPSKYTYETYKSLLYIYIYIYIYIKESLGINSRGLISVEIILIINYHYFIIN